MRIDDDSHVQVDHLKLFLNRLDPSRPLFIGGPGSFFFNLQPPTSSLEVLKLCNTVDL